MEPVRLGSGQAIVLIPRLSARHRLPGKSAICPFDWSYFYVTVTKHSVVFSGFFFPFGGGGES